MRLSSAVTLLAAGVFILAGEIEARKKGNNNNAASSGGSNSLDLSDFERGRRGKKGKRGKGKKKVTPVKRFNYLFDKLQLFAGSHVKSNWKKMNNKMRRFKSVAENNLGSQKNPRQVRCMKVEESEKFQRQLRQKERKMVLEEKRSLRLADQIKRRANRLDSDEQLFDDDFVERKKRDTTNSTDEFDYNYYYYGDEDDYEVYVGEYESEFDLAYPDYEHEYEELPGNGIQARGRRKKKKGKGRKLGPVKIFFNINQALTTFINQELKACARKNVFVRRLQKLQKNFKKNAPVLTKPPSKGKKCKGRKCRKQKG